MANFDTLLEKYFNRYNRYNVKVLEMIGNAIKKFDGINPTTAHRIAQELKYGTDLNKLVQEIKKITNLTVDDIHETFDIIAKQNLDFAETYYKAKNKEFIDYKNNIALKRLVNAIANNTAEEMINISNTKMLGFVFKTKDGETIFKDLKTTYYDVIDEAVFNITTGVDDYKSAMRRTIKQLADSGVRIYEDKLIWESGYNRRIDSSVRMNVLEGARRVFNDTEEQIGKEIDADGVEISAHLNCAEDHLDYQGMQYTIEEYNRINEEDLKYPKRNIGTLNCKHYIRYVVLGIDEPQYSKEQLEEMRKQSLTKKEYDGKEYTMYQATQVQRKLESQIRKQKDRQIMFRITEDRQGAEEAQSKINSLVYKYNDFSKQMGLKTYKERLSNTGYNRIKTKEI